MSLFQRSSSSRPSTSSTVMALAAFSRRIWLTISSGFEPRFTWTRHIMPPSLASRRFRVQPNLISPCSASHYGVRRRSRGLYQYTSVKPHAVTLANGKSYSYDNCGNMIVRGAQLLSYDEENQLMQVNSNGVLSTFGYADGGGRLWKQAPSGLQVWIGGLYEEK